MYKLMIVDDEAVIREGIASSIPWQELGFTVTGLYANGKQALAQIGQDKPDVVLSDIRMPKMDGIELMRALKESYPDIKVIILSGYSDFEYMNMSIKNNVTDYLLKPTDLDEFRELFQRLRGQLDEETAARRELEQMKQAVALGREHLAQGALHWLLRGYGEESMPGSLEESLEDVVAFYPLYGGTIVRVSADGRFGDEDWDLYRLHMQILESCNETVVKTGLRGGFFLDHEDQVTGILGGPSGSLPQQTLLGLAKELQRNVKQSCNTTISLGLSQACNGPQTLAERYTEALCSVNQSVFLGEESIFFYSAFAEGAQPRYELFDLDALKLAVQKDDFGAMDAELARVFKSFAAQAHKDYHIIDRICLEALLSMSRWAMLFGVRFEQLLESLGTAYTDIYKCDSLDKKHKFMAALLYALGHKLAAQQADTGARVGSVAQLVKQCIDEEFANNALSLEYAAQKVGKTPAYISKIFKAEFGYNFSEYLLQKRLTHAVQLLRDPSLKVYEIAGRVGYVDTSNFIKVFKKQYGASPHDYRLKLGMGQSV